MQFRVALGSKLAAFLLSLLVSLLSPSTAAAFSSTLTIDATRSTAELSGTVTLDFGLAGGPSVSPIQSQLDFPVLGASGGVIADGRTSDGLFTSVTGTIDIDQAGSFLGISGGTLTPDLSGIFTPSFAGPFLSPAQLAGAFFADDLGLGGEATIRNAEIELAAVVLATSFVGDAIEFGLGSVGSMRFSGGFLEARTDLSPLFGGSLLPTAFATTELVGGSLTEISPGQGELVVPYAFELSLGPDFLSGGIPMTLDLQIQGTLIATGEIQTIPEPATGTFLGIGLIATARSSRRWRD